MGTAIKKETNKCPQQGEEKTRMNKNIHVIFKKETITIITQQKQSTKYYPNPVKITLQSQISQD